MIGTFMKIFNMITKKDKIEKLNKENSEGGIYKDIAMAKRTAKNQG